MVRRLLLCALFLSACSESGSTAASSIWSPAGGELGMFPDDALTRDDPSSRTGLRVAFDASRVPSLAKLPETFQKVLRSLNTLDGFGLTAGITVRFDRALDPTSVPSGDATADLSQAVVLAVETPDGPKAWPYESTLVDNNRTIILNPMVPLPPRSHVFVAVTTRVRGADGQPVIPGVNMAAALQGQGTDASTSRVASRISANAQSLVMRGVIRSKSELAVLIVWTTQSVHEDSLAIAADIAQRDIRPQAGTTCTPETQWVRCEGSFTAIDYRGSDGTMPDVTNHPDTSHHYVLPFTAWLPLDRPGQYGGTSLPTMIFGHGLGGTRQQAERLATFAAPRGIATIAVDAPMHGQHPTASPNATATLARVLDFFAISAQQLTFEPLVMREHFREASYDKLQLVRMLSLGVDLDGDGTVDLDPHRLMYLGVSLGGIMGPELLALAPEIHLGVLVVPGGKVSSIIQDGQMFEPIIELMKPRGTTDGDVARFFPILQTLIERGDSASWAPSLLATPPAGFPNAAPHLLMGMVIDDDTVPNTSNRTLARALDIPQVPPMLQPIGIVPATGMAPISANLADGRTAGVLQFDHIVENGMAKPATHSNIGDSAVGVEAWMDFIDSYLKTGTPVIVDPYAKLGE
jgi:pimeloyl-ACP methyl ester carboxylesterase